MDTHVSDLAAFAVLTPLAMVAAGLGLAFAVQATLRTTLLSWAAFSTMVAIGFYGLHYHQVRPFALALVESFGFGMLAAAAGMGFVCLRLFTGVARLARSRRDDDL